MSLTKVKLPGNLGKERKKDPGRDYKSVGQGSFSEVLEMEGHERRERLQD